MTAYTTIPDTDINPDKPIKSETGYALRDNPLAIAEGDPSAPSINPAALLIGGKGIDGIFDNATPAFTDPGYYEFASMSVTAAKNLPLLTMMRIAGNASISNVLTVTSRLSGTSTQTQVDQEKRLLEFRLGAKFGVDTPSGFGNIGGSSVGSVWSGYPQFRTPNTPANRTWVSRIPFLGGTGVFTPTNKYGGGGGCLILIVEGNFDATGGTINADGSYEANGGAGGSIYVIATGSITNGTYNARGAGSVNPSGQGGGGLVQLVASSFIGTQTVSAAGGGGVAEAGFTNSTTLTRDQIRTILQRM